METCEDRDYACCEGRIPAPSNCIVNGSELNPSAAIAVTDLNKAVSDAMGTVRIAPLDVRLTRLLQGLEALGVTVR